jgi:ferredoxin
MSSQDSALPVRLRVVANRSACCGYGVCAEICPQVFGLDDNGIVTLKTQWVAPELQKSAREAVQACPQNALEAHDEPA